MDEQISFQNAITPSPVEDLGEIGPLHQAHIDLNVTLVSTLNPITRMALAAARLQNTAARPLPTISLRKNPGSAKRLQGDPNTVPPRGRGRVGRNDLCHCGSGKKFGKCCLLKLK